MRALLVGVAILSLLTVMGCAERTSVVRRERVEYPSGVVTYSEPLPHQLPGGMIEQRTVICRPIERHMIEIHDEGTLERRTTTTTEVSPPPVVERRVETHEVEDRPQGLISGLVHFVGEIIALPFRIVGGVIRLLF